MAWRPLGRTTVVGIVAAGTLALSAGVALAVDNNHNGQIDYTDNGLEVWCVQHVVHSYFGISIGPDNEDWDFGRDTERGVKKYQGPPYHSNLSIDGQVGVHTGHAMYTDVQSIRRTASQTGETALFRDTGDWLNKCTGASSLFR